MTLADKMWMPASKLDIEKIVDVLPPIAVTIFELGRWCVESVCPEPELGTAEDLWHQVITLPPQYISGVKQWGDIKTGLDFIHANRMWIALRLMDTIHKFVRSIQKKGANDSVQEHTGSASSETFWAWVRDYQIPNKLRQQQKTPRITYDVIANPSGGPPTL